MSYEEDIGLKADSLKRGSQLWFDLVDIGSKADKELEAKDAELKSRVSAYRLSVKSREELRRELRAKDLNYGLLEIDRDNRANLLKSCELALADRDSKLEQKDSLISKYIKAFGHYHVNNGFDDSCLNCNMDLRNPIHTRLNN